MRGWPRNNAYERLTRPLSGDYLPTVCIKSKQIQVSITG